MTKLLYKCRTYLIHLNMRGCQYISQPSFTSIGECCNLQDLNFSQCISINVSTPHHNMRGCQYISQPSFTSIGECCNLQDLNFSQCISINVSTPHHNMRGCQYISQPSFTSIGECCNLQDLNFSQCISINVSTLHLTCEVVNTSHSRRSPVLGSVVIYRTSTSHSVSV